MNGRVYDPLTAQFFSPDPQLQAPDNWLNYNKYSYAFGNPFKYTDPSGEFFWIIPNIGWSKEGGLSIGVSFVFGIPCGASVQAGIGYNFKSNDAYIYAGATLAFNTISLSYSTSSGFSAGYTAGASLYSGLPISTNFATLGVNYSISHNSLSGNISAWQVDQNGLTFNPSVSATIFPEHTTNLVRGQGFRSNDKVLSRFVAANNQQGALDYWGIEGTYDASVKSPYADPVTGEIFFNEFALNNGFDRLNAVADHEMFHKKNILNGNYKDVNFNPKTPEEKGYLVDIVAKEEFEAYMHNYKNEGLYRNHKLSLLDRINENGRNAGYFGPSFTPTGIKITSFQPAWWHNIYKIPRIY